jgi:hypothetical protein
VVAERLEVEEHSRNDERPGKRPAPGLVGAGDEPHSKAPIEHEEPAAGSLTHRSRIASWRPDLYNRAVRRHEENARSATALLAQGLMNAQTAFCLSIFPLAAGADLGYAVSHAEGRIEALALLGPFLLAAGAEAAAYGSRGR